MKTDTRNPVILIADDDPDDQLLIQEAFAERCANCQLCFVANGVELMGYLRGAAPESELSTDCPLPDLLLLDLNMPLKDGRQALLEIRADPALRELPTIVLTTSGNDEDKAFCLAQGANDYIVKPSRYTELLTIVTSLKIYCNTSAMQQPDSDNNA
ncbi:response regulator [Marinobacter halophilus]|uniref:Two-component system response regulator n=1 Tax=Marinobacter halophilus TaxID=1323740 RepID=A0A2T1KJG0_9GAMM|nr:response regulator [Marinobacter halophilus]PSF10148.1 two-component system response regulator [Marinobacter halophilus]GGC68163.1 response regulator [Marinobacter halophilus]